MPDEDTTVCIYQLRVWLREISPAIWRRVLMRSDSTIADLHYTIQIAMGWTDTHLHQFLIHGKRYGVPKMGGIWFVDNPHHVRLEDFRFREKERFLYEYDFGDQWHHEIRVEKHLPFDPKKTYPVCIGGARRAPPEDCGGPWAFLALRDHYSPASVLHRLWEMQEAVDAGDMDAVRDQREAFAQLRYWLTEDRCDRRQVNRRLRQYAVGDEQWLWE